MTWRRLESARFPPWRHAHLGQDVGTGGQRDAVRLYCRLISSEKAWSFCMTLEPSALATEGFIEAAEPR